MVNYFVIKFFLFFYFDTNFEFYKKKERKKRTAT